MMGGQASTDRLPSSPVALKGLSSSKPTGRQWQWWRSPNCLLGEVGARMNWPGRTSWQPYTVPTPLLELLIPPLEQLWDPKGGQTTSTISGTEVIRELAVYLLHNLVTLRKVGCYLSAQNSLTLAQGGPNCSIKLGSVVWSDAGRVSNLIIHTSGGSTSTLLVDRSTTVRMRV
jgi:hypothetical protein